MDITDADGTFASATLPTAKVTYPSEVAHNVTVKTLAKSLSTANMRNHLEVFTSFFTRYYKSETGVKSAAWLFDQVESTVKASGAFKHGATVKPFEHPWGQSSIIATIPGRSKKTIVIGAHQDSINMFFPSLLPAPGADDDGSGTVTILEALRVLLSSPDIVKGKSANTIEFHWYSAEEGGLLGSQAIFKEYHRQGRDIKGMVQQDMTGYTKMTLEAGHPESVGVITDFTDPDLTEFIKRVIVAVCLLGSNLLLLTLNQYCDIPFVLTKCGYACSDHASARKYGYPSAFVIESAFEYSDQKIHTIDDKIEYLNFDHMLQHAKLTLGFAYEAAMADL